MRTILILFLLSFTACKNSELQTEPTINEINEQPFAQPSVVFFPLDSYLVSQDFGIRNNLFSSKYHCAEDLIASAGTEVNAMTDGIVSYSGSMGGYGWLITIDHENDQIQLSLKIYLRQIILNSKTFIIEFLT